MSKHPWYNPLGWFKGGRDKRKAPAHAVKSTQITTTTQDPEWTFNFNSSDSGEAAATASVWVYGCSDKIATAAASVRLVAMKGEEPLPPEHPLSRLLARPVPGYTQTRWMQTIAQYLTLTGENYLEKVRAMAIGRSILPVPEGEESKGLPHELWPFGASMFTPEVNDGARREVPIAYTPNAGDTTAISPEDMIHMVYPRPGSTVQGLAPTEASEREISIDRQASEWQQTSLQNRGVPDGVFKHVREPGGLPMTQDQHDETQERIDKYWTDLQRSHKPFLLGANLDWIDLAKTAVELELMGGREFAKLAICAAMGVPTVLFDASGATFANLETARMILWTGTVLPLIALVVDTLNMDLVPEYGDPEIFIMADLSKVDALLPLLRSRWEVAKQAISVGVSLTQANTLFELGLDTDFSGSEAGLVAANQIPISTFGVEGFD